MAVSREACQGQNDDDRLETYFVLSTEKHADLIPQPYFVSMDKQKVETYVRNTKGRAFRLVSWKDILHCCFYVLFDAPLVYWILE
jgi:hypothetical protein